MPGRERAALEKTVMRKRSTLAFATNTESEGINSSAMRRERETYLNRGEKEKKREEPRDLTGGKIGPIDSTCDKRRGLFHPIL